MEVAHTKFGENTSKALSSITEFGMQVGGRMLKKDELGRRLSQFFDHGYGIRKIPSGDLRQAAIKDVIEETRRGKLQDSIRYLEETSKVNNACSLNYNPDTGQVGDFRLNGVESALQIIGLKTNAVRDKEWIKNVSMQTIEVEFDANKQITNVTFIVNGVDKDYLKVGLTKSQIKVATIVMEYNKKKFEIGSDVKRPSIEVKSDFVRLGAPARVENFYQALKK